MICIRHTSFEDLDNIKVVYEYLDNDEGEIWLEILEIYVDDSKTNIVEYIKKEFLSSLAGEMLFSHKESL